MHRFFQKAISLCRDHGQLTDLPDHLALEIFAERRLNHGTRTYSPHSQIIRGLGPAYLQADELRPFFGLCRYPHDPARCRVFRSRAPQTGDDDLLVHPDTVAKLEISRAKSLTGRPLQSLPFYALASFRSVLYQVDGGWQRAKLHLHDVQISRYCRSLGGRTIQHSVAVSRALGELWSEVLRTYRLKQAPDMRALGYYEEFAGTVLANPPMQNDHSAPALLPYDDRRRDGEWGSLRRGLYPYGVDWQHCGAVPLFAFYGQDGAAGSEARTLLQTMIEESGEKPGDFICRRLLEPVIRAWVAVFVATGIIWEPHAQNLVFLCDLNSLEPKALALRDADTAVSAARRQELGLSTSEFSPRNLLRSRPSREMPLGERSEISRVLDVSMGRNTFDYLARLYGQSFAGQADELQVFCRQLFREIWPDWKKWLPQLVYSYAEQPLPADRNCYPLLPRPELRPFWRPF